MEKVAIKQMKEEESKVSSAATAIALVRIHVRQYDLEINTKL
jgi:hypothetical protein